MQQHTIVYQSRIADLHAAAEADRLAREVVRAEAAQSLADRVAERVAERARRWVKAA
ncbi:hypothetical protein MTQ01_16760 [Streptomyces sp. XM4193]|uniref:Uncharacterized protein n=1 Tax=Streptomyces tardus TaxID=2780544 RepID=A0A949N3T8_9ACTN|nr:MULTISPECIES: hypothetical protein [Streptomyces]MBU7596212.1 hypothetical protein [Streptomyces tardus]MCK1797646.1 hypothetical protein [Streptomyces sp. XM4193]